MPGGTLGVDMWHPLSGAVSAFAAPRLLPLPNPVQTLTRIHTYSHAHWLLHKHTRAHSVAHKRTWRGPMLPPHPGARSCPLWPSCPPAPHLSCCFLFWGCPSCPPGSLPPLPRDSATGPPEGLCFRMTGKVRHCSSGTLPQPGPCQLLTWSGPQPLLFP